MAVDQVLADVVVGLWMVGGKRELKWDLGEELNESDLKDLRAMVAVSRDPSGLTKWGSFSLAPSRLSQTKQPRLQSKGE